MTDDEWLRSSAEASPRFAARVYEKFRQGMSMKELAQAHGVSTATIEALIRQAMVDGENAKTPTIGKGC